MATNLEKRQLFEAAEGKFERRRQYALDAPKKADSKTLFNIKLLATLLQDVKAEDIMSDDSRQTFAIGLMEGNRVIAAVKGVKEGERYTETVAREIGRWLGGTIRPEYTASPRPGMHAEMAIVEYLLARMPGDPKGNAWMLGQSLQIICFGKGVCPDCAGWMNRHFIPHLSMYKSGSEIGISYDCGSPSQGGQWTHPRTGAKYESHTNQKEGAVLDTWQKGKFSIPRPL